MTLVGCRCGTMAVRRWHWRVTLESCFVFGVHYAHAEGHDDVMRVFCGPLVLAAWYRKH